MRNTTWMGYLEMTLAQVCVASAIVMAKFLVATIPAVLLLGLRFVICGVIISAYALFKGLNITVDDHGERFSKRDWWILIAQALCGGFFFNILIVGGLHYTTATTAGIISSTIPAAITVMSVFFLREAISRNQIVAVFLAVLGLVALCMGKHSAIEAGHSNLMVLFGDFLVLLAVFPESLLTIIAKWHGKHVQPIVMATIVLIINTVVFIPFLAYGMMTFDMHLITMKQWIIVFFYAMASICFYKFWYAGIAKSTANVAALFTSVMPLAATILSALALHEVLTTANFIGMILVISSIVFGANIFRTFSKAI